LDNVKALSAPQQIVCNFARENDIPVIDLLPFLDERMKATGTKPGDYFLDDQHPSPLGSNVVADTLSAFIRANKFLSPN
jgi:lysophospholipase L1-like esterase